MTDNDDDDNNNNNNNSTFIERTIGEWTSYQDENNGQIYYHNETTGESQWDPPTPGFEHEDKLQDDDDGDSDGSLKKNDDKEEEAATAEATDDVDDVVGREEENIDIDIDTAVVDDKNDDDDNDDDNLQPPKDNDNDVGADDSDDIAAAATATEVDDVKGDQEEENIKQVVEEAEDIADGQDMGNGWVAYEDQDTGGIYYYNADTGQTQWDKPNGPSSPIDAFPDDDEYNDDSQPQSKSPTIEEKVDNRKGDQQTDDNNKEGTASATTAEQFLQQPEAVMERNVMEYISTLVEELGPQIAGPKAMTSLMNGYNGDTSICGVLGLWLAELKSMGGSIGGNNNSTSDIGKMGDQINDNLFQDGANSARDVAENVINRLAKEHFTKEGGHAIMQLSKKEAAFIDKMIGSSRWRKLLIDLSATNKDSKLFMYCLQSISNLGHHREIANRINQSDYFGVFNSMLQSELGIAGKVAVDGYTKEVSDSTVNGNSDNGTSQSPMKSLIADLRRTCTSTSFTYLYAMEVLRELLSKSNKLLSDKTKHPESFQAAIRKWERLSEEIEDEMLKPQKSGTSFQRKRRIDVAITMSDLFQRKRRRVDPRVTTGMSQQLNNGSAISSKDDLMNTLDDDISQLLTKNSLGIQIDKEVVDNVLKFAYGGSTDEIGNLLIKHPMAVSALLGNLFGPSNRIRQLDTRLKCSRLVALAVTASERKAGQSSSRESQLNEDAISQVILKGSQLCEQLENMVSFTVLDKVDNAEEGSVGRQLSALCIQHAVVSQGTLVWMRELASGSEFAQTASYPTISPCILSLARLICRHHPLTRPAVLEISLIFLGHTNREISHKKMSSIKEQCIRLMLWLSTQGLALGVISALSSEMEDSALIRYFFAGILEIIQPPLSMALVGALAKLMLTKHCLDALQSKHFEATKQEQIAQLIHMFDATADEQEGWEEDKSLLIALKSKYTVN